MDGSNNNTIVFVVLWLLSLLTVDLWICRASSESEVGCIPSEQHALLTFKLHLLDPSNRLSSWSPTVDCCKWPSIVCSNVTGHILQLHLNTSYTYDFYYYFSYTEEKAYEKSRLGGEIHPSLLDLKYLNYLDLSGNYFGGMQIPTFLTSMKSLTYLNLSNAGFNGSIPPQIGNLSNLLYLDLGGNDFSGNIPHQIGNLTNLHYLRLEGGLEADELLLTVENLQWMSALSLLQYLQLSYVNLSKAIDWLHVVHSVPSLTELHLRRCDLHHYFQPSTINFSSLLVLDIPYSFDFGASSIPKWIFQLQKLVSLLLPNNNLQGSIPYGIQNLTLLKDLDLSYNMFNSSIPDWLYGFSHLKFLNLYGNNLGGTISNAIGNLTSLVTLDLSYNQLEGQIPRSLGNLCNLRCVFFTNKKCNQQVSEILEIFSGCVLHTLEILGISGSQISGHLTDQIGLFKSLVELALPNNAIQGALPTSLGKLTSLKYLSLSGNQFNGNPFEVLGSLSKLKILYLENNLLQGDVNEAHLANFTSLILFHAFGNQLTLKVGPNWNPSFQLLENLKIASWHLGPDFPSWIQSLKHLTYLDVSNTWISKSFPTWFWSTYPNAQYFNLSHNSIHGELSNILNDSFTLPKIIDLSWNQLSDQLPHISPSVVHLDLSNNWFSGSITNFLCQKQEEPKILEYLNLASNNLSGKISDCWMMWPSLGTLKLESNHFTGSLPLSMGSLASLNLLHIRNNTFSGKFPVILKNITKLISLDLGENEFSGIIPPWVGQSFLNLKILRLRSNNFSGPIPHQICGLRLLQILDFSKNNFTGHIPKCINHLRAIQVKNNSLQSDIYYYGKNETSDSVSDILLMVKGRDVEYNSLLGLVTSIDLSNNKLSGEIPTEITSLMGLHYLNLSNNLLSGQIPHSIGDMGSLETMDFSKNQLFGEIPTSISSLNFLSMLNLSYNNLRGKIPTGTQLQSFEASGFVGNDLCGPPLTINCTSNGLVLEVDHNDKEDDGINWFFVSMAMGFVVGFWAVVGPLLYHRSWRYTYFQFLNRMLYKLQSRWC